MSDRANGHSGSICSNNGMRKPANQRNRFSRDVLLGNDLSTDGLICAFEFVRGRRKTVQSRPGSELEPSLTPSKSSSVIGSPAMVKGRLDEHDFSDEFHSALLNGREVCLPRSYWIPIGWNRISQLVQTMQIDAGWAEQPEFLDEEDDVTVADLAAPYWERAVGPTWWCHVAADHPHITAWLTNAQWLHPAISVALQDESKLISERMKHLRYEV